MAPGFPETPSSPADPGRPPLPALTFEEAWSMGVQAFKSNYGALVAAAFVVLGASAIDNVVSTLLERTAPPAQFVWMAAVGLVVTVPLNAGMVLVGANMARRGHGSFTDLFLAYRRLGPLLGWTIIAAVVSALAVLPAVAVVFAVHQTAGEDVALAVGLMIGLVYLCAFIFVGTRLQLVGPMLIDPNLPARPIMDTVKASWRMTSEGRWLSLFTVYLASSVVMVLSILLLCIGLPLVGYPLYIGITGAAYAMLTEDQAVGISRCTRCGYDLTGLAADACPECGAGRDIV